MDTADKIGLLSGFEWLTGHSFWTTLIIMWALTPGMMIALGILGESRLIPLWSRRQFRSFFPGDFFLGLTVAGLLALASRLPAEQRWYNSTIWHALVLTGAIIIAAVMTYGEWDKDKPNPVQYRLRAILSPTKLYHNVFLYVVVGYVGFTTLVADLGGLGWAGLLWVLATLLPGCVWLRWVAQDSTLSSTDPAALARKVANAHVPDWRPISVKRPDGRRYVSTENF